MKRQLLVTLVLLLFAFRSFSGTEQKGAVLLPGADAIDLLLSPLSACRYKKPFPFQCAQLIKKRLSNPPDVGQLNVFNGRIHSPATSNDVIFYLNNLLSNIRLVQSEAATLFYPASHWHACGIDRNVFHPPPGVA